MEKKGGGGKKIEKKRGEGKKGEEEGEKGNPWGCGKGESAA